jgi:uncharacterized membrane protein
MTARFKGWTFFLQFHQNTNKQQKNSKIQKILKKLENIQKMEVKIFTIIFYITILRFYLL